MTQFVVNNTKSTLLSCAHVPEKMSERFDFRHQPLPSPQRKLPLFFRPSSQHIQIYPLNYVLEVFIPKYDSTIVRPLKLPRSRFGFHNGSSIDSLLDKEDVSLEAILDEDDLLQECKAQNTRLIDYFQRSDVLQRLLGYVTGQIEGEDRGRFKCVAGFFSFELCFLTSPKGTLMCQPRFSAVKYGRSSRPV